MTNGTPKTLEGAVRNALEVARSSGIADPTHLIVDHVRDFLSQKFTVLMCQAGEEELKRVNTLWDQITSIGKDYSDESV